MALPHNNYRFRRVLVDQNQFRLSFETVIGRSQIETLEIGILQQLPHQIGFAGTIRADADRRDLEVVESIDRAHAPGEQ